MHRGIVFGPIFWCQIEVCESCEQGFIAKQDAQGEYQFHFVNSNQHIQLSGLLFS